LISIASIAYLKTFGGNPPRAVLWKLAGYYTLFICLRFEFPVKSCLKMAVLAADLLNYGIIS